MKQEDVQKKLDVIPENLEKLKTFCSKSYQEFISDSETLIPPFTVFRHLFKPF